MPVSGFLKTPTVGVSGNDPARRPEHESADSRSFGTQIGSCPVRKEHTMEHCDTIALFGSRLQVPQRPIALDFPPDFSKHPPMNIEIALYQPDIPQNAGTILRLGACMGIKVNIIHPAGFSFSEKLFRRSAMDYANQVEMMEHDSFDQFEKWRRENNRRLILLSTKANLSAFEFAFLPGDILMAGRESAGVPASVSDACDTRIRIPMKNGLRSLNVATACAMTLPRALHMTGALSHLQQQPERGF